MTSWVDLKTHKLKGRKSTLMSAFQVRKMATARSSIRAEATNVPSSRPNFQPIFSGEQLESSLWSHQREREIEDTDLWRQASTSNEG
jgi:hypothetical protein